VKEGRAWPLILLGACRSQAGISVEQASSATFTILQNATLVQLEDSLFYTIVLSLSFCTTQHYFFLLLRPGRWNVL
jgi:hypothetical protein